MSSYANLGEDGDSDIFSSALDDPDMYNNPFADPSSGNDEIEPLHAGDAASRLLDTENGVTIGMDTNANANAGMDNLGGSFMGGSASSNNSNSNSLLERIQQQKAQQGQPTAVSAPVPSSEEVDFGYPMAEDGNFSYSEPASASGSAWRAPDYSPMPGNGSGNASGSTHYVHPTTPNSDSNYDTMINVLSAVGSAAGTAAKGAYRGGKYVYGNLMAKRSAAGGDNAGMGEMDYQRESLLMDPHDLEDRAGFMSSFGASSSTAPSGLRAGGGASAAADGEATAGGGRGEVFLSYAKQFSLDMKDLFLGAPRHIQIAVVGLFILIGWLIFSEV